MSDSYHPQIIEVIYSIMAALVQTSANRTLFLKSRCISTFVEILKKQTDVHQNAMKVLSNVLTDIDCAWEAVSNGAFITIIQCLESKNFDTVSASLTALSNLAFHEDLIDLAFEDFPSNQTLDPIIKHLSSTNTAVRDRAVRAVSNLLAHQSSQPWFQKTEKCLKRLIEIAKTDEKGETHETRERAVTAIFHMTMHTDEMRNFVIMNGLDQLLFLLTSPKQPLDLKKEIAKAMINLSLSDETFMETKAVAALLEVIAHGLVGSDSKLHSQDRKRENEIEELIAISLENLATSRAATAKIERCGGVLASIAFLSRVHHIPSLQEHSALLIARFAINSRMRAHYQARGIEQLLADMDTKADPAAQATIRLAIHHVSMKHYEDDLIPEPENAFPEFDDLIPEPENAFPEFDDLDLDTESEEEEDEEFSEEDVKKIAITTASLVSDSPAMRSVDEEEIVDHSISKEFYAIEDEDPSPQVSPLKKGQSLSTKKDKTKSVMTFLSKRRRSSAAATEEFSINLPKVSQRKLHRHLSPKKIISTQSYDPERLKLAKMHYKRTKVAQELLSSEATYVRNLSIMIKKYLNPLSQMARSKKPLIKENQLKLIFSTVEALFGYHSMLLEILNQRMARWSTKQKLGDVYLDIGESFKAYTEYINNFNTSQQTLEKCVNSSAKVAKWLEHTSQSEICKGQNLITLLITPVQRLPRCALLLKELKASTPELHEDGPLLEKSLLLLNELITYLNEKKRELESNFKIVELGEKLVGDLTELYKTRRIFHLELECSWRDKTKKGTGYFYVFDDTLLYTKHIKKKQKIRAFIPTAHITHIIDKTEKMKILIYWDKHTLKVTFQGEALAILALETLKNLANIHSSKTVIQKHNEHNHPHN
uniref:DH domain-containing protein n=1 Tax=Arcella intermedia TaxID=1963864 RepID=A0A6B2KXH1_9EUKA